MKTIEHLTTSELIDLQREHEFPKSVTESAILRGVTEELRSRDDAGKRDQTLADLEEERDKYESEVDEQAGEIRDLKNDIEKLETKIDEKEAEIIDLKEQLSAAESRADKAEAQVVELQNDAA